MKIKTTNFRSLVRGLKVGIGASASGALNVRDRVLKRDLACIDGFVCVDGSTFNISVRKNSRDETLAMMMRRGARGSSWHRVDRTFETDDFVQFFGKLPHDGSSFQLRLKSNGLESRLVLIEGLAKRDLTFRSAFNDSVWNVSLMPRELRFALKSSSAPCHVLQVIPGVGRIIIRIAPSSRDLNSVNQLRLKNRATRQVIDLSSEGHASERRCIIDLAKVAKAIPFENLEDSTWDVWAGDSRIKLGRTDIDRPRAVYHHGWTRAKYDEILIKMRPYWTNDSKLAIEMKIVNSSAQDN